MRLSSAGEFGETDRCSSKLFLRLALFHVHGEKDAADTVLGLLLRVAPNPGAVVRGAYAGLAVSRHRAVLDDLMRTGWLRGTQGEFRPQRDRTCTAPPLGESQS